MTYEIRIGESMCLGAGGFSDTWSGKVVFVEQDGKETTVESDAREKTDRGKRALRAKLNDLRRRYEHHYETTGKRFEVERKAKEQAERGARHRLLQAAPDLLEALQVLLVEVKSWSNDVAFSSAKIAKAEAAIQRATLAEAQP
jgi:hypothetical protein